MRQTELSEFGLEWLAEDFVPTKVTHHTNHKEVEGKEFDDQWAMSMGYEDHNDMIAHSNKKHQHHKIQYGDKYIREDM